MSHVPNTAESHTLVGLCITAVSPVVVRLGMLHVLKLHNMFETLPELTVTDLMRFLPRLAQKRCEQRETVCNIILRRVVTEVEDKEQTACSISDYLWEKCCYSRQRYM